MFAIKRSALGVFWAGIGDDCWVKRMMRAISLVNPLAHKKCLADLAKVKDERLTLLQRVSDLEREIAEAELMIGKNICDSERQFKKRRARTIAGNWILKNSAWMNQKEWLVGTRSLARYLDSTRENGADAASELLRSCSVGKTYWDIKLGRAEVGNLMNRFVPHEVSDVVTVRHRSGQ